MTTHRLFLGNALDVLPKLLSASVDLAITSPPYWGLRFYGESARTQWPDGWFGQLGLEPNFEDYLRHVQLVFRSMRRVLKPTGSFYLNIGDTYASSMGKHGEESASLAGQRTLVGDAERPPVPKNVPFKSLCGIPWRLALGMMEEGWVLRNCIIWHKPNHMPSSVKDRLSNSYEFIFHFANEPHYYYDLDPIREKPKHPDAIRKFNLRVRDAKKGRLADKYPGETATAAEIAAYPDSEYRANKEYNGKFAGTGENAENFGSPRARTQRSNAAKLAEFREAERNLVRTESQARLYLEGPVDSNPRGKNPGDLWELTTVPFPGKHFAVFPEKVCRRPILSSSPPNGWVLDPFAGSGTVAKVARDHGRNSISIEVVPEYEQYWHRRLDTKTQGFGIVYEVLRAGLSEPAQPQAPQFEPEVERSLQQRYSARPELPR